MNWPEEAVEGLEPPFTGGNSVTLLKGGDEYFPALHRAIESAQRDICLASYIFYDDATARGLADALCRAARRGVRVSVVVDGFGSSRQIKSLRELFQPEAGQALGVDFAVFRPLNTWYAWLQPGQMRRLHQKLCSVDGRVGFVGGINIIDDRLDISHGQTVTPRLDFAVELRGPVVASIERTVRAVWSRAVLGSDWKEEAVALARSSEPIAQARDLIRRLRLSGGRRALRPVQPPSPVRVALVIRDNVRRRRAIERSYIEALRKATQRIDFISPYFYPGRSFRLALVHAAKRGVKVRVVLQGKVDYRIAAMAARVYYDEMLTHGIRIFEYTHAYLHAKIAVVDNNWSTVGSSNIDPLSLLLNLEANVVVDDEAFAQRLSGAFELALEHCTEVTAPVVTKGWRSVLRRSLVASLAHWYLRLAGISGRY